MKIQLKLVKFMRGKAKEIEKLTGIRKEKYFDNQDAWNIVIWEDEKSKKIWERIKSSVGKNVCELHVALCPFCLYYKNKCMICTYGINHDGCYEENSDFYSIGVKLDEGNSFLSVPFYKELVKKI